MPKPRILYIFRSYPQISETYMDTEIAALRGDYDIEIVSRTRTHLPTARTRHRTHHPFTTLENPNEVVDAIRQFQPHVIHTHWLFWSRQILQFARATDTPFTIRAHSFDTIVSPDERKIVQSWLVSGKEILTEAANDPLCLGIVAFPFSRQFLEERGVPPEKIHDSYPVIDYARFHDETPNGEGIMNTGACIAKKKMEDFLDLGARMPDLGFNLYPVSYLTEEMKRRNESMGNPVTIMDPVEPPAMPAEYKKHRWMVYTACPRLRNVGWPLSIAEAQASGVGVVLANVRPDLKDYVGDAGFLYDSLDDVEKIIRGPVPDEIRAAGFAQAKKSDIEGHKDILTDLWAGVVS